MKACPNCLEAIPTLRIARCQNSLHCPRCGTELSPDRRSQILMFAALVAFLPLALFLGRRLPGHSFGFRFLFGLAFGMCAAGVGCLIYAWTVRLHRHRPGHHRSETRSWRGLV